MAVKHLLVALAIAAVGCNTAFTPGEALVGTWGGDGVSAALTASGGQFSFVCADGTLDSPLVPDSRGRVNSTGISSLVGGAARPGDYVPEAHPVRYFGKLDGSKLTLTVVRSDIVNPELAGPYVLHQGDPGNVSGCPLAAPH